MLATISPVLPSLLTNAGPAVAGAVHADVTSTTCGDARSAEVRSLATARDCVLCAPPSDVRLRTSSISPRPNLSASSWLALAESDVGS